VVCVCDANLNDSIVVLLGNGGGTFLQLAPFTTGTPGNAPAGNALALADRIPDLVPADCCGLSESVYLLGIGDGTFQAPQNFTSGASVAAFAVADWNNDGIAGLALAQSGGMVMAMESALNPKFVLAGSKPLTLSSAAGGVPALAPGSLASAFGADLANGQPAAPALPWPSLLEGTSVSIVDSTATYTVVPLTYISANQVNFQIPDSVAIGPSAVTVTSGDGTDSTARITLTAPAPAPVRAQLRQTRGRSRRLRLHRRQPDAGISLSGDKWRDSGTAAGLQGAFLGLDQINVVIPSSLAGSGSIPIVLTANGQMANTVNVTIQ
jgi:hypothetical protein